MTPPVRPGPRPLPLHLAAATLTWQSSLAAWPLWRSGSLPWNEELADRAAALARAADGIPAEAFGAALAAEAAGRLDRFMQGVAHYRSHPARRAMPEPATVWQDGATRLLDFGGGRNGAATVLVVPSLINRYHVLDLAPERSFVRTLARCELRPLLVDWGEPGAAERRFRLGDYIAGRLEAAMDTATGAADGPVAVLGYCMGGLLALALALRRPDDTSALALLATPWDFHAGQAAQARLAGAALGGLEPVLAAGGVLPVDALQAMFAALDPLRVVRKFVSFAALDPASERARMFVLLEDWLNDGVPLAAPVARECLAGWYGENRPARGLWTVAGARVDPAALRCPVLAVLPARDRIVPPASAAALADAVPGAVRWTPSAGHIGMVAGAGAAETVAQPLARWLRAAS